MDSVQVRTIRYRFLSVGSVRITLNTTLRLYEDKLKNKVSNFFPTENDIYLHFWIHHWKGHSFSYFSMSSAIFQSHPGARWHFSSVWWTLKSYRHTSFRPRCENNCWPPIAPHRSSQTSFLLDVSCLDCCFVSEI